MRRFLLTACLLLAAVPPAAAQQPHNQPHAPARPGRGQPPHPGMGGGMPPHVPPHHNPDQIHEQETQWWLHQMQMQQELDRQYRAAREARRKHQASMEATPKPDKPGTGNMGAHGNDPSPEMTNMGGKVPPKTPPPGTGNMGAHGNELIPNTPGMGGAKRPATTPGSGIQEPSPGGKPREGERQASEAKLAAVIPGQAKTATPEVLRQPLIHDQGNVGALLTVYGKLRKTDNDYEGHRLHAMEAVASAVRHLGSHDSLGLAGSGSVPPAVSDTNLRESLIKLRHVEASLSLEAAPTHHAAARHAVAEAIRHVHAALQERGQGGMAMR